MHANPTRGNERGEGPCSRKSLPAAVTQSLSLLLLYSPHVRTHFSDSWPRTQLPTSQLDIEFISAVNWHVIWHGTDVRLKPLHASIDVLCRREALCVVSRQQAADDLSLHRINKQAFNVHISSFCVGVG